MIAILSYPSYYSSKGERRHRLRSNVWRNYCWRVDFCLRNYNSGDVCEIQLQVRTFKIKKYKTFSALRCSYINKSRTWIAEKLCGNTSVFTAGNF